MVSSKQKQMGMTIVLVTGGFDPIHKGHIAYFNAAKKLGDKLIVGMNSDAWLSRKKGRPFMPIDERITIVQNLKMVDEVILFDDTDGSAIEAIKNVRRLFPTDLIIFANGGDRVEGNTLELSFEDKNLKFVWGVGGTKKMNSSSWILNKWKL
jgi:D-beta-D-heptose 7-phosphate kinase/D-beta-D-heptose 1-phosphate adenosyltransferase